MSGPQSGGGGGSAASLEQVLYHVKRVIVGQDALLERMLVAMLTGGHLLVEGVPGLAKTLAVSTLADALGIEFQRVQFTPDLVPADIVGTRIYNQKLGEFEVRLGPIFANLVLADEINRAPAKVQSALLEAMQERQVTIGRDVHRLPDPFLVMATQNPIESDGTYPLPEAQVDRFMLKVLVDYPTATEEFVIVERMLVGLEKVREVMDAQQLRALQQAVRAVYVDPTLIEYAVQVAAATRNLSSAGLADMARYVTYGVSPRASIYLATAARALALMRGRQYVLAEDLRALAPDVLRHRLVLSYEALGDGVRPEQVIDAVLARLPVPDAALRAQAPEPVVSVDTVLPLTPEQVLRRLEWQVIRRLEGRLQGDYHTLLRGQGTDIHDLRNYEWGDDVRHIDWNVTARMDELFVREFMEDRELTAWLLLDRSRSMDFGAAGRTKEWMLTELAATLAQLLVRGGNRVGAVVYDGEKQWTIPPRQGRHQVLLLVRALLQPVSGGPVTDLGALLDTATRVVRRRSLVVLISDFISEPGWERRLVQLTERHEVVAIQLMDPREQELPDAGLLFVQDAETGEQLLVDSSDPELRRRLRAAVEDRDEAIRHAAARARVDLQVVSTEDDLVTTLVRLAGTGRRRRR